MMSVPLSFMPVGLRQDVFMENGKCRDAMPWLWDYFVILPLLHIKPKTKRQ